MHVITLHRQKHRSTITGTGIGAAIHTSARRLIAGDCLKVMDASNSVDTSSPNSLSVEFQYVTCRRPWPTLVGFCDDA